MTWHGQPVDPGAIRRTSLLVVEGERDDICGVGQTMAALDLCRNIPAARKELSSADRSRPLRRVQRQGLDGFHLPEGARPDPGSRLTGRVCPARM